MSEVCLEHGKGCDCNLSISILGDGCAICQPETHKQFIIDTISEIREEIKGYKISISQLKYRIHDTENDIDWLLSEIEGCEEELKRLEIAKESYIHS